MAIARIFTSIPERANSIAEQLRARGFSVEVVPRDWNSGSAGAAGEQKRSPADLEIVLESCDVQAACERAAQLAGDGAQSVNIYVAAGSFSRRGVLQEGATAELKEDSPASAVSSSGLRPADTVKGVAAGLQHKRDLLAKALRGQRLAKQEARRAERERLAREEADLQRQHEELAERANAQAAIEAERQRLAEFIARKRAQEESKRWQNTEPMIQQEGEEAIVQQSADQSGSAPFISLSATPEVSTPEVSGQERTLQRIEAVGGANDWQSQQAGDGTAEVHDSENEVHAAYIPAHTLVTTASIPTISAHRPRTPGRPPRMRLPLSTRGREWRIAVIASSLFAILLILGWKAATRGSVQPLPASISRTPAIQQELPFGAATIGPTAGGATRVPYAVGASQSARVPTPSRQTSIAARRKAVSSARRAVRQRPSADDSIANDVVVYNSRKKETQQRQTVKPAPTSPAGMEKASLKRFSDLN